MRIICCGKNIWGRFTSPTCSKFIPIQCLCASPYGNKPPSINSDSSVKDSSSSLNKYNEQYKALDNLDFTTAAKILFSDPPKHKKFGLDFHVVQLFFICLPSLAVYLVAQYARSEMKKMDAELELKKQAEFEAKTREMELKAAEEKAALASDPEILKVNQRLDKLEESVQKILVESQKSSNKKSNEESIPNNEPENKLNSSVDAVSKDSTTVSAGQSGPPSQDSKK